LAEDWWRFAEHWDRCSPDGIDMHSALLERQDAHIREVRMGCPRLVEACQRTDEMIHGRNAPRVHTSWDTARDIRRDADGCIWPSVVSTALGDVDSSENAEYPPADGRNRISQRVIVEHRRAARARPARGRATAHSATATGPGMTWRVSELAERPGDHETLRYKCLCLADASSVLNPDCE